MSRADKLNFINNVPDNWKIMFDLYDWLRWSNTAGRIDRAEYNHFMQVCENELYRIQIKPDSIPNKTNDDNFQSRWDLIKSNFDDVEQMKNLLDHNSYRIGFYENKIHVRFKNDTPK